MRPDCLAWKGKALTVSILANVPLDPNQGSGYVISGYAQALAEQGHSVSLSTTYPSWALPHGKGTAFRTRVGMIRSFSLARKSDVLLLWGGEAGWLVPRLKQMKSRGVVIACSNGLETHNATNRETHSLGPSEPRASACFRNLDGLMLVSRFDEDFAIEHGYQSRERRVVIPNPLPQEFIGNQVPAKPNRTVLFVGNWIRRKGSTEILEMIRHTSRVVNPPNFSLIGAGTSKVQKELNLPNVVAIDPGVSRSDLLRHYMEASILIMPSRYESFGMVATESMACGCAVVATKTGYPYELEHEKEVLHVPFEDGGLLADAVLRLLDDRKLKERISHTGYRKVQELTWENAGIKMNNFIHRIVELGPQ